MDLAATIRDIPDFPKPGILFKDITTLLRDPAAFRHTIDMLVQAARGKKVTAVVGIESRGFIFGTAVALELGVGFVPIRKPGKLPAETITERYSLEYGEDAIQMHKDALSADDRVLLIDDLLATGGTMRAAANLVERTGATVAGIAFVIELAFLDGRAKLGGYDVTSLVTF